MITPWEAHILADVAIEGSLNLFDLYLPNRPNKGLIVYIHGGGWEQGSNHRPPGFRSILKAGFALAAVQYRFSDQAAPPEMVHDIILGARSALAACKKHKIEIPALFLWGISAGGHLASLTAHIAGTRPSYLTLSPGPLGVASWCGPMDLSSLKALSGVSPDNRETITRILSQLCDSEEELLQASPITYAGKDSPPHLFVHGDKDDLVPPEQSRTMHKKLREVRKRSELMIIPGGGHPMPPGDSDEIDRTIAFFEQLLERTSPKENH